MNFVFQMVKMDEFCIINDELWKVILLAANDIDGLNESELKVLKKDLIRHLREGRIPSDIIAQVKKLVRLFVDFRLICCFRLFFGRFFGCFSTDLGTLRCSGRRRKDPPIMS